MTDLRLSPQELGSHFFFVRKDILSFSVQKLFKASNTLMLPFTFMILSEILIKFISFFDNFDIYSWS